MSCKTIQGLIQQELDGELTAFQLQQVEEHLRFCTQCRAWSEEVKQLDSLLRQLPQVSPPFSITDRVLQRLETDEMGATFEQCGREMESSRWRESWGWKSGFFSKKKRALLALSSCVALLAVIVVTSMNQRVQSPTEVGGGSPTILHWIAMNDWQSLLAQNHENDAIYQTDHYRVEYEAHEEARQSLASKEGIGAPVLLWSKEAQNGSYEMQVVADFEHQYIRLVRNGKAFFTSHPIDKHANVIVAETSAHTIRYEVSIIDVISNHQYREDWQVNVVTLEEIRID